MAETKLGLALEAAMAERYEKRIAELETALRLCIGALDRWQGTAPLSEAQVQARAVLKKSS